MRADMASDQNLEALFRELTPQAIAILVRRFGQFDAVEDAV
jgi:predicted RNA polymerase sigma factor